MARYIDAEKAKRAVFWDADSIEAIDQVPTADVVEVVRCKDCKFSSDIINGEPGWCEKLGYFFEEDFFCSYGEKPEED